MSSWWHPDVGNRQNSRFNLFGQTSPFQVRKCRFRAWRSIVSNQDSFHALILIEVPWFSSPFPAERCTEFDETIGTKLRTEEGRRLRPGKKRPTLDKLRADLRTSLFVT